MMKMQEKLSLLGEVASQPREEVLSWSREVMVVIVGLLQSQLIALLAWALTFEDATRQ